MPMLSKDDLSAWSENQRQLFETAYLASDDPYRRSGWGSTPERWRLGREVILDAVPRDGHFLDIGCANGLLLECLLEWGRGRGVSLVPHGLDLSPRLVELARERLPAFAGNLHAGNALTWTPPRRYDYVYTLLEFVPDELHARYLQRLLDLFVAPDGRLIIGNYGSRSRDEPPIDVASHLRTLGLPVAGSSMSAEADGWPMTRVAWMESGHET